MTSAARGSVSAGLCVVRLLAERVDAPAEDRLVRRMGRLQGYGGGGAVHCTTSR